MKLLYIAPTKIEMERLDGVAKKIVGHAKVFSTVYDVVLLYRDGRNVVLNRVNEGIINVLGVGTSKYDILKFAFSIIKKEQIDSCYIRYPNSDPMFLSLLKKMKSKGICVVIEIPTYPYDAEGKETLKGRIISITDACCRNKLRPYVDRIITYSDDDAIFNIKTIKTINGLDFENVRVSITSSNNEVIHLCGVATIYNIHGYDRLIKGLDLYYRNGGKRKIVFDIVGDGDIEIIHAYKRIVTQAHLEHIVFFHGRLHGTELDDIYDMATIGVNSLAIHRQNLKNESTLKTREYAAKGLPILSSSFVDAFSVCDNKKYVCRVPADDSPINIQDVLNFYDTLSKLINMQLLKEQIRANARSICDMPITLKPIIDFINEECREIFIQ